MEEFDILIVGSDINAYYMARCYHEAYNKKANMIGKQAMKFTSTSKIINFTEEPNLWDNEVFKACLENFALKQNGKKILLVGSNDTYVRLIVENGEFLKKYFVFNYPSIEIMNNLLVKDKFYSTYGEELPIPKTIIYNCKKGGNVKTSFNYPIVLKPSDGVLYYKHKFPGQSKVYKIKSEEELLSTIDTIKESGYDGNLIIQEFIPGDDSALFDVMFYVGKDKKVKLMTFAQIGLQEHTHTGVGNCTVLINGFNEYGHNEELIEKLRTFLEKINFQGFGEFDLKYDIRDGKYKVFEINPRQSRSGYYLASCGHNLVKCLVDDLILNKNTSFKFVDEEVLMTFVPKMVIKKHIKNVTYKKEALKLIKNKKYTNPLKYSKDLKLSRRIYLLLRSINYIRKYKNSEW